MSCISYRGYINDIRENFLQIVSQYIYTDLLFIVFNSPFNEKILIISHTNNINYFFSWYIAELTFFVIFISGFRYAGLLNYILVEITK